MKVLEYKISEKEILDTESLIGNTPLVEIKHLHKNKDVRIYAKIEWLQLSNSIKARAAFSIIKEAIDNGKINKEKGLIDASSGNTAVAYAAIGARLGIPITLCVPENASNQKKSSLISLGANIIFTSRFGGTDEAQEKAKSLYLENPDLYYYSNQYDNENNWKAHYNTTALEIWNQTKKEVTHFVAGLGTTGTFVGTSRRLKELNPNVQTISLQPDNAMHGLEGWKHLDTARIPRIYDSSIADNNLNIDTLEAYDLLKIVAKREGMLLSPSAAANLVGAIQIANTIDSGVIVTTFADALSNYPELIKEIL